MLDLLKTIVEYESPSLDKNATDALSDYLGSKFEEIGCKVSYLDNNSYGKHALVEWGKGPSTILVLCHIDTVCSIGEIKKRPFKVEKNLAYGPGSTDMKGGIVQGYFAFKKAIESGLPDKKIIFLLNTDEEVGSPSSKPHIEKYAKQAEKVFVLEPPVGPAGAIKTSRKGVGIFNLKIKGKSAHAGAEPEKGVSALQELAHQIHKLHNLNDYSKGTTVNVGVAGGGTRSNVVAEWAWAEVEARIAIAGETDKIINAIKNLEPNLPGINLTVEGGLNRPPMERTEGIAKLYQHAKNIASQELGFELPETTTGGASDGNFTAALGVPTLDGLGSAGEGGHSDNEFIYLEHLANRTALLTRLFETL
ncbi:MAG: M20 family metallopeptidase [Bacillota bacterium]